MTGQPLGGYLVVLRSPKDVLASYNPAYRGLCRTPPFSERLLGEGFQDPYVFGDYADERGLISSAKAAGEVLARFAAVYPAEKLEILFAERDGGGPAARRGAPPRAGFLGFDVAGESSPFWSIVVDSPPPDDPRFRQFVSRLNGAGLFDVGQDARSYLDAYRLHRQHDYDLPLTVWAVHLVDPSSTE